MNCIQIQKFNFSFKEAFLMENKNKPKKNKVDRSFSVHFGQSSQIRRQI